MSNTFSQGLLIAAIGMGLVFLALIMLWGLMALMVNIRFKGGKKGTKKEDVPVEAGEVPAAKEPADDLRAPAAAAAVAAALRLRGHAVRAVPHAPKTLSPWQVAGRFSQFSQNRMITNRKPRGSAK